MNTSQFIDSVYRKCSGYKSLAQILSLTNDAQNELLGIDCDLMRIKPDPTLATTSGIFEYMLPVGVRTVNKVYTRNSNLSDYKGNRDTSLYSNTDKLGNLILDIPVYIEPSINTDIQAVIKFDEDYGPNTATSDYRYEGYMWPEQLTSTSIPLSIPLQYVSTSLMARVMLKIDEERFGRAGDWFQKDEMYKNQLESYLFKDRTIDHNTIRPFNA